MASEWIKLTDPSDGETFYVNMAAASIMRERKSFNSHLVPGLWRGLGRCKGIDAGNYYTSLRG